MLPRVCSDHSQALGQALTQLLPPVPLHWQCQRFQEGLGPTLRRWPCPSPCLSVTPPSARRCQGGSQSSLLAVFLPHFSSCLTYSVSHSSVSSSPLHPASLSLPPLLFLFLALLPLCLAPPVPFPPGGREYRCPRPAPSHGHGLLGSTATSLSHLFLLSLWVAVASLLRMKKTSCSGSAEGGIREQ